MQKWEYVTLTQIYNRDDEKYFWTDDDADERGAIQRLNEVGQEGWELVAVHSPRHFGSTGGNLYFLKRPTD